MQKSVINAATARDLLIEKEWTCITGGTYWNEVTGQVCFRHHSSVMDYTLVTPTGSNVLQAEQALAYGQIAGTAIKRVEQLERALRIAQDWILSNTKHTGSHVADCIELILGPAPSEPQVQTVPDGEEV